MKPKLCSFRPDFVPFFLIELSYLNRELFPLPMWINRKRRPRPINFRLVVGGAVNSLWI